MYVQSREELYQYSARQRRGMDETTQDAENTETTEDFYLEGGEELNFP